MPYRRLPNTDRARLRALKTALEKGAQIAPFEMAFSQKLLLDIRFFVPKYEQAIQQYLSSKENQARAGRALSEHYKSARMYVSHFLQTLNMCIARGEIKASVRRYYGLKDDDKTVPDIGTEPQLVQWGQQTIAGEEKRVSLGGTRLFNPSIAKVKVHFEMFLEHYHKHKDLLDYSQKMLAKVAEKRHEADRLILETWNEVESTFDHLEPLERREACSEYGVVYIFRPYEKKQEEEGAADSSEKMTLGSMRERESLDASFNRNR